MIWFQRTNKNSEKSLCACMRVRVYCDIDRLPLNASNDFRKTLNTNSKSHWKKKHFRSKTILNFSACDAFYQPYNGPYIQTNAHTYYKVHDFSWNNWMRVLDWNRKRAWGKEREREIERRNGQFLVYYFSNRSKHWQINISYSLAVACSDICLLICSFVRTCNMNGGRDISRPTSYTI